MLDETVAVGFYQAGAGTLATYALAEAQGAQRKYRLVSQKNTDLSFAYMAPWREITKPLLSPRHKAVKCLLK